MKSISMSTLSRKKIRRKGSEAIGAVTAAPELSGALRWNMDYAALGVRGAPRGRKSGAGPGATNPR